MGDISDMMVGGEMCMGCGVFLGRGNGHPRWCRHCANALGTNSPKGTGEKGGSSKCPNVKNLPCDMCGRKFSHERALDEHRVRKHDQEPRTKAMKRVFTRVNCPECGQRFNVQTSLDQHRTDKHGIVPPLESKDS